MSKHGWTYKKLGEVSTLIRGKGIQRKDFVENGFPCIHYGQLHTAFGVSTDYHISEISPELYSASIKAQKGDVLMALTSENVEGSCKSTAWLGDYEIAVGSDAAIVRHSLSPKFIVYYFNSNRFFGYKSKYARGFKVTHIKVSDIESIPIPVPSRAEQEAIVAELDEINGAIMGLRQQVADLDTLAQATFYDMFGDPVTNPKGWDVKKLKDVCCAITDGDHMPPPKASTGIPFITISNIDKSKRTIDFKDTFFVPQNYYDNLNENRKPRYGDVLYTVTGSYGIPVLIDSDARFCFQRHIALLRPNREFINQSFLCYWALSNAIKFLADKVATGIAQKTVGLNSLRQFIIILPPLALQQEFAAKVEAIEAAKAELNSQIGELQTLLASRMEHWFG